MTFFRFAHPILLAGLVLVALWLVLRIRRKPDAMVFSMTADLARLSGRSGGRLLALLPTVLRAACLVLLVLAAARPQWVNVSREVKSAGVDILLCLDTSGSMRAMDFKLDGEPVTRLAVVQRVVGDFIKRREHDRIGLVVFGEEAFTQAPLTLDKGLLLTLVNRLTIGMAGDRTAVGSAIAVSGKRLKDLKAKDRLLILLTDGRSNAGEITPEQAAEAVSALGVKIYTIGVGGTGRAPFRIETPFGPRTVYQRVDLDEKTLKEVARIGGGKYFRASDAGQLAEIYDFIDKAEKTEVKIKEFMHFKELYGYALIPALVLLLIEVGLKVTVLRGIP